MSLSRHVGQQSLSLSVTYLLPSHEADEAVGLQVNPEDVIRHLSETHISEALGVTPGKEPSREHLNPYMSRYASQVDIPKYRIPSDGAPADTVYNMLRDELDLDGKPNLNLARLANKKQLLRFM